MTEFRVGVDIGGTFTDWVMADRAGNVRVVKTPTTPDGFSGVFDAMDEAGATGERFRSFAHGTTLGTNALIERRLPRVAMVTTKGITAVLTQSARGAKEDIWDIYHESPRPSIVRPRDRLEVTERTLSSGVIRQALDENEARRVARILRGRGTRTVAVCFLHSYTNGSNEARMREIILEEYPEALVRTSHETIPLILEYERFTTTILNVALIPVMIDYLEALEQGLRERDYVGDVLIVQSAGGLMGVKAAAEIPVRTANSGPAAGAIAAREFGAVAGFDNVIGLDIGGTSTDVSVTLDGQVRTTGTWEVEWGHPIMFPAVDIITVGAGGGSVAWFDPGGKLRSGPHSMGAVPGPACYAKGGDQPTSTDAHVVLGNLRPGAMLGGAMELSPQLADRAISKIGRTLGSDAVSAAAAVIAIAEANMANAIRLATLRRGLDPQDFALVAFGGAGPLHGAMVAAELTIPKVVIPPNPGLTSALGCLLADIRHDLGASMFYGEAAAVDLDTMNDRFDEMEAAVRASLDQEGIPADRQSVVRTIDMCYAGQWRVFPIPVEPGMTPESLAGSVESFRKAYLRRFTFDLGEREVEIHGINVTGAGITDKYRPQRVAGALATRPGHGVRPVYWRDAGGWIDTPIWSRPDLPVGFRTVGPAIVEQMDSTTLVPPAVALEVDPYLNLVLDTTGGRP
ncbi:hydantoinase/oxoprolinase family protein [Candidatus Spongiisocius sp.]|uniref:hydantoinase/oxoprolinase family protein n=1 Tax=Candidatus Spongiisocius sp. TaxID=3101273 RepID=UPI003B5ACC94